MPPKDVGTQFATLAEEMGKLCAVEQQLHDLKTDTVNRLLSIAETLQPEQVDGVLGKVLLVEMKSYKGMVQKVHLVLLETGACSRITEEFYQGGQVHQTSRDAVQLQKLSALQLKDVAESLRKRLARPAAVAARA